MASCRAGRRASPDVKGTYQGLVIPRKNTDPGSNAGVPGLQIPIGIGAASKLPVGMELDGPAGSDRRLVAIGLALEGVFGRLPPPGQ